MSRPIGPKAGPTKVEKAKLVVIYSILALATTIGFVLSGIVGRASVTLAGLGLVAYVFGLRHGVDADHIAAIDNTTRKLLQERKSPLTTGMWFSLGHSTVVIALIVGLVFATRTVAGSIPQLQNVGGVIGTTVSGTFLWVIGLVNLVIVVGVYRIFQVMRQEHMEQAELDNLLESRGFMNRFFRPLFRIVKSPWQIYPIGFLFGLGFDTASEVALIAISIGVGVSSSIPIWMILVLPLMFTCGMVLVDTSDGVLMTLAYGWAFLNPMRKIYYNLTVTIISIVVALGIGTAELLQVLTAELSLSGPFWNWLQALNFETMGYGVVVAFVATWIVSLAVWKYKRFDEEHSLVSSFSQLQK
jgi:high-affinity nickel-transport protein